MSKTKTILLAGGAVSAALVIAVGVWAFGVYSKASEKRAAVKSDFGKLGNFYNKAIFPSDGNVEILRLNGGDLAERYAALSNILARGAVAANKNAKAGDFLLEIEKAVDALRAAAPKDEAGKQIIPDNFYFGFEKYDKAKGIRPADAEAPRLLRQLGLAGMLSRVFYDAGVLRIEKIAREEFDSGGQSPSDSSGGRSGSRFGGSRASRSSGPSSLGSVSAEPITDAPVAVSRERFGFEFMTREDGLVRLLNSLNAFLPFAIIHNIEFGKSAPDAVFPAMRPVADASARPGANDQPGVNRPPEGNAARIISGALRESPVKAVLTLDVYDFEAAAAAR